MASLSEWLSSHADWFSAKGVITTAVLGSFGWLTAYVFNSVRDDKARRLKATIDQTSNQIREFYAPLASLTDQLWALADVQDKVVKMNPSIDVRWKFYGRFILPIHKQIVDILSSKVYHLDGYQLPDSFKAYFRHYSMERASYESYTVGEPSIPLEEIDEYPPDFYDDVRVGYQESLKRYEASVRKLTLRA